MKVKELYTVITEHGSEVLEEKPQGECFTSYIIEADEGKVLTFGNDNFNGSVQTDTLKGWSEV